MSDKQYQNIMEALEVAHVERVALMRLLISTTPLNDELKKESANKLEKIWNDEYEKCQKRWEVQDM